jgi:hypothetical protein
MKNAVFWDVLPCGPSRKKCFRGTYFLYLQGGKWSVSVVPCRVLQLLHNIYVVLRAMILSILDMELIHFSKLSVLTRAAWRHIPEDSILQLFTLLLESY